MSALFTALHLPAAPVVGWSDGGDTGFRAVPGFVYV